MKSPYFVLLKHQSGERLLPLVDANGTLMQFQSRGEAGAAATSTVLGAHFGFIIFDIEHDGMDF